jgi:hypothetical protein
MTCNGYTLFAKVRKGYIFTIQMQIENLKSKLISQEFQMNKFIVQMPINIGIISIFKQTQKENHPNIE